jgi:hypothetical protein
MNLRATHHGHAYQDLITGIALVDLMLGSRIVASLPPLARVRPSWLNAAESTEPR